MPRFHRIIFLWWRRRRLQTCNLFHRHLLCIDSFAGTRVDGYPLFFQDVDFLVPLGVRDVGVFRGWELDTFSYVLLTLTNLSFRPSKNHEKARRSLICRLQYRCQQRVNALRKGDVKVNIRLSIVVVELRHGKVLKFRNRNA